MGHPVSARFWTRNRRLIHVSDLTVGERTAADGYTGDVSDRPDLYQRRRGRRVCSDRSRSWCRYRDYRAPPLFSLAGSHRSEVTDSGRVPHSGLTIDSAPQRALPVWGCPSRPSLRRAPGRWCWFGWSARSAARTNDLDHPEGWCRLSMGRSAAAWGLPALPGCSTNVVSSATTIGIGCPRKRRARSRQCYMAVQPGSWRACAWQEQTAVATRDVRMGDRDRRD